MAWMFAGYLVGIYSVIAVWFFANTSSFPLEGTQTYFLILPGLAIAASLEVLVTSRDEQNSVKCAFQHGLLSRHHAFFAGGVNGLLAVGSISATWLVITAISNSLTGILAAVSLIILELMLFSAVGIFYLAEISKIRLGNRQ